MLTQHPLYPQLSEWLREDAKNEFRAATFLNYTHQMERRRNKCHLDLEHPAIKPLLKSMEQKCGADTLNLQRYVLRRWLEFRGIKVNDETLQLLRRKSGRRTTNTTSGDLLTRKERE